MFCRTGKIITLAALLLISTLSVTAQGRERVLIAYFTWAENTEIIDRARAVREANNHVFGIENSASVDTVTSASVIPPGNTAKLASCIQETIGGELFSITVEDKYSCYWNECLNRASEEKARRARPGLTERVHNVSDYDVIFLGFPTWWYTIPMAVATFVESHDLSDKKIIPFVSHGTSGIAGTIRDLRRLLPSSTSVDEGIGVFRSETNNARYEIERWLEELGYTD